MQEVFCFSSFFSSFINFGYCQKQTCLHKNKVDNQITKKLRIIKTFWNIYLQDNYHFKDLDIQKKGLTFRIRIKNASQYNSRLKNPQKRSPNWIKTQTRTRHPRGPFGTLGVPIEHMKSFDRHFPSADWPKLLARLEDSLIEIRLIFYDFLEIRLCSNFYLISFFKHPNNINRGNKSELRALLF